MICDNCILDPICEIGCYPFMRWAMDQNVGAVTEKVIWVRRFMNGKLERKCDAGSSARTTA